MYLKGSVGIIAVMEMTNPNNNIGRKAVGYTVNAGVSSYTTQHIKSMQQQLRVMAPGAVWLTPPNALHITVMDWLAPLVNYGSDTDELFTKLRTSYSQAMRRVLADIEPFEVHFDTVKVFPDAIIIVGHDNGQLQAIRQRFTGEGLLLPGTKPAPVIIHSTIARFTGATALAPFKEWGNTVLVDCKEPITVIRVAREYTLPMLEFEVVEQYHVGT